MPFNSLLPIEFRKAQETDLPYIVALLANDPLGSGRESEQGTHLNPAYLKAFACIEQDLNQELTVACLEEEIVGTFQLSFIQYLTYMGGLRCQVEAVRVKNAYRGKGIGQQILKYCVERAKSKKAHLLQLTTDNKRPDAIRFYEDHGFVASHQGMKLHLNPDGV